MRSFSSDNASGLCPEALAALIQANDGDHLTSYGDDPYTASARQEFKRIFSAQAHVEFVATGTAANTLAIAAYTDRWDYVLCHRHSHWACHESTAPERITQCRTVTVHHHGTKIVPEDIPRVQYERGDVHQPQPGVLTISNPTEFGEIYTPEQVHALATAAHAHGLALHVDGARFANAVAALGCTPAALTSEAGVDALSFGGTKNGLAYGEAVLFFPQGDGQRYQRACKHFPFHRKSSGHLLSKQRFVSAPFAATLKDDIWLHHARQANQRAEELQTGFARLGLSPRFVRETNALFVALPEAMDQALKTAGHHYYPFGEPDWRLFRLMCSFDTRAEDIEQVLSLCAATLSDGS